MRKSPVPALLLLAIGLALLVWLLVSKETRDPNGDSRTAAAPNGADGHGIELVGGGDAAASLARASDDAAQSVRALSTWPIGEPATDTPGTGRILVRLVDGTGAPLPNHPIEVDWWKGFGVSGNNEGRTDEHGRFRTDADRACEIDSVGVPLPDADTANLLYHGGPFAAHPARPDEIVVEVPAPGWIRGRVSDLDGRPVEAKIQCDVHAALDLDPFLFRMRINDTSAATDERGRFELFVVSGRYSVSVDDDLGGEATGGGPTTLAVVTLDAQKGAVDLELRVAHPLRGRTLEVFVSGEERIDTKIGLTARTEAPVLGLPAAVPGVEYRAERQLRRSDRVAPGRYLIENLKGDPWTLFVWIPPNRMLRRSVPTGATRMDVEITPAPLPRRPEKTIRVAARLGDGTLVRPTVKPHGPKMLGGGAFSSLHDGLEGEPVTLYGEDPYHLVVSYRDLAYAGVGPLDVDSAPDRVEVPLGRAEPARVELVDTSGNPVAATFELSPPWSFFRRILPSGRTEPGTREGYAPVVLDLHRIFAENGVATFSALGSTAFRVFARPLDGDLSPARGIVRGGETLTLTVGSGIGGRVSFVGRLVDAHTGGGIQGARVEAFTAEGQPESDHAENVTGPDGRFVLTGLPAALTEVQVFARGYALPHVSPVDLRTLEGPLELHLHHARRVPLRLLDSDGQPLDGATIRVRDANGHVVLLQDQFGNRDGDEAYTDGRGRVDILGVPAGHVRFEVAAEEETNPTSFDVDAHEPFERLLTLRLSR